MAILNPSEYDASYFDGGNQTYTHNAGYKDYSRFQFKTKGVFSANGVPIEESTGTYYGDLCKALSLQCGGCFVGKKMLVIGSAYGYEVEAFRALGADAYGMDVSAFAYSKASAAVQPYLMTGDIRSEILLMDDDEYDYIFSRWFLSCMSDDDLTIGTFAGSPLITELNRVSYLGQVHIINPEMRSDYYNAKTIAGWTELPFATGTKFIVNQDVSNPIIVT